MQARHAVPEQARFARGGDALPELLLAEPNVRDVLPNVARCAAVACCSARTCSVRAHAASHQFLHAADPHLACLAGCRFHHVAREHVFKDVSSPSSVGCPCAGCACRSSSFRVVVAACCCHPLSLRFPRHVLAGFLRGRSVTWPAGTPDACSVFSTQGYFYYRFLEDESIEDNPRAGTLLPAALAGSASAELDIRLGVARDAPVRVRLRVVAP